MLEIRVRRASPKSASILTAHHTANASLTDPVEFAVPEKRGDTRAAMRDAYPAAIAHCADSILRMHAAEKMANKIFGRNLQSHAAGLLLVMHCEAEFGLGAPPTLAALSREMGRSRSLATFFGVLRLAGYVKRQPVPGDARSYVLVPSSQLFDGLRGWLTTHARCCEIMGLTPPGFARRLEDANWLRLYLASARDLLQRTREATNGDGAWAWFDRFDCGDRVAMLLLRTHHDAAAGPDENGLIWFAFDGSSLGRTLGISRSHVRNIINGAEAAGYLVQNHAAGRIALRASFLDEMNAWFCRFWGWVAETHDRTALRVAGGAAVPPKGQEDCFADLRKGRASTEDG